MDQHPIQGEKYSKLLYDIKTGISSSIEEPFESGNSPATFSSAFQPESQSL
jgi:hypothetical protein